MAIPKKKALLVRFFTRKGSVPVTVVVSSLSVDYFDLIAIKHFFYQYTIVSFKILHI